MYSKNKNDGVPLHIFELNNSRKLDILIFPLLFITLCAGVIIIGVLHGVIASLLLIPILLGFIWITILSVWQKVLIYSDGIVHCQGKRRSFVPWEDLMHIMRPARGVCGISTASTICDEVEGGMITKLLHHRWDSRFLMLSDVIDFPVKLPSDWGRYQIDMEGLQETKFGQIIFDYAPHLFEK